MVSGVSFRGPSMESAKDILNQPQTFANPNGAAPAGQPAADTFVGPKKHKARNAFLGTLATVAIVAGGLAATHHFGGFTKAIEKLAPKEGELTGVRKFATTACDYMDTAGKTLCGWGKSGYNWVKGVFGKGAEEGEAAAAEA